ncbi:MAG TPA: hypothetical protein VEB21_19090 [Terriglobales bacterium]|nr:hypothetical protein [Terriglobales bacterium]
MPGAGLFPIHTDKLTFGRDGRWYADGEPVLHPRLASFFSRHLRRKPDGTYEIWVDERFHADVEVEDTPFVVVDVDSATDGALMLVLNDGTSEPLAGSGLRVTADESLSCAVKDGRYRARLLRPAQQRLEPLIEAIADSFEIRSGSRRYPIHAD